jgi:hypothetical protein
MLLQSFDVITVENIWFLLSHIISVLFVMIYILLLNWFTQQMLDMALITLFFVKFRHLNYKSLF